MTLKEKFENTIFNYIDSEWDRRDVSSDLEFDAEEFAIGFAEWVENNCDGFERAQQKQLLEIYKKEKGL